MISFRLPWYSLTVGAVILIGASFLPISSAIKWPVILAGGLLLMDGGLGLRTLPSLVPFASFSEDWQQIEREMYFGQIGKVRWGLIACACICLALFALTLPGGDWQIWAVLALMLASAIGWVVAALRAIREVLGND